MSSRRRRTQFPVASAPSPVPSGSEADPLRERLAEVLHDLHTPLAALSLLALPEPLEGGVEDEARRQLRRTVTALRRQTQVLRDHPLLRQHGLSLSRSRCDLDEWLAELRPGLEELSQARGMALEWRGPAPGAFVEIDGSRLACALEHLFVQRSRRSKRPGTLLFEVALETEFLRVRISSVDSAVSDPLSPVDREAAGVEFARSVIEAHEGRVSESATAEGIREWNVVLPRSGDAQSIADPDSSVEADSVLRVMVVEDDAALRDLLCDLLSIRYPVSPYRDATDALQGLREGMPDLMVVDHGLPDGTGLELARRIREIAGRDIPLLLVTGSTVADELGVLPNMSVLSKPFRGTELLARSVALLQSTTSG